MKKLHILAISLVSLLTSNVSNAFVSRMELWKNGKDNNIILMSDIHVDTLCHATTLKQKKGIIDLAKSLNAYGIFEDPYAYTGTDPEIKNGYNLTRKRNDLIKKIRLFIPSCIAQSAIIEFTPLCDLTAEAKKAGIECESIEFRQSNWSEKIAKIKEISNKYKNEDSIIMPYKSPRYSYDMNMYFNFCLEQEQNLQSSNNSLEPLPSNQEEIESYLLDIEILCALNRQLGKEKTNFIIYAGGGHIKRISSHFDCLKELGFKKISVVDLSYKKISETGFSYNEEVHFIEQIVQLEQSIPQRGLSLSPSLSRQIASFMEKALDIPTAYKTLINNTDHE